MKNLSLKWRVVLVGAIPLICFSALIFYFIYTNYSSYREANVLTSRMEVIEAASDVVDETQKERGRTATYINGGSNISTVEEQRKDNDVKISKFKEVLKGAAFSETYKQEIFSKLENLADVRNRVDSQNIALGEALKEYTSLVVTLLDIDLYTAKESSLASISSGLKAFRILEDAKESGGKLRANMSGILASNKPISDEKFSTLVALKAGVDSNLGSSGLVLDEKSENLRAAFNKSKEWHTVNDTFNLILKNADKGDYYQDSNQFFGIITSALNVLGKLVVHEKDVLKENINEVRSASLANLWKISVFALVLFSGAIGFMLITANTTSRNILNIVSQLVLTSKDVANTSSSIATTSSQLSEAATEQASSLQETVSSIDEISSMVQRNSDAAKSSTQISSKSKEAAMRGKQKVEDMIRSINEISSSNDNIMVEMQSNNEEISKIINVISLIGEKTKVINDIVFQTKLLSFNASVEAARAGEHGKGFAVVAEEVGNLASMSGKAALEISEMLDSSIKQVTDIVESSKGKMVDLVKTGKEKVELGTKTATDCGDAIDEIMQNVSTVNETVREIATASAEQSTGVQEVTKAMQQLDEVTHQNTSVAQESSHMAKTLNQQALRLDAAVSELTLLVQGKGKLSYVHHNDMIETSSSAQGKVLSMPERVPVAFQKKRQSLKISGLDTTIPCEDDSRFEDL